MKNLKYVLVMFIAMTAAVSCSDDNGDDPVNPIVGTWSQTESELGIEVSVSAIFNENSSGTMIVTINIGGESASENSNFTWSTEGDQLTLTMDGESAVSTYSISGNKLTIDDLDGVTWELTRS